MKAFKPLFIFVVMLSASASLRALLPPQFTSDLFDVNPGTHPSRIILKYFKPVDKGFKIEIGEPANTVQVIDLKEEHRLACWEYDLEGNLKEKYELEYNENGLLDMVRKKDKNQNAQVRERYVYSNPKNENTLQETRLYKSDDLTSLGRDVYYRDKKGLVSEIKHFDGSGKAMYSTTYVYTSDGLVENEIQKDAAGNKRFETEYAYDEEDRMISEIVYDADGKTLVQTVYTYNVKGLVDTFVRTTTERKAERYVMEYIYDERGNWIQQVVFKGWGHVPEMILIRILTY